MFFLTIITFLIVFSLLVIIHELGHYFAARFFKVKIEEFGLGLPPRAVGKRFKKDGMIWSLNWIPLGGFVRMKGQDDFALVQSDESDSFTAKSKLARAIILIAGVAMNYLLAVMLLFFGFLIGMHPLIGSEYYNDQLKNNPAQVIVSDIADGSRAAMAGFQIGDEIISVSGQEITSIAALQEILQSTSNRLFYRVERGQEIVEISVNPDSETHLTGMSVNSLVQIEPVKLPIGEAIATGFHETNRLAVATVKGIGGLVVNVVRKLAVPEGVAGPVGIASLVGEAAQHGLMAILQLTALLSISLAVINIMPFPALDGGHLLFIVLELLIFGKKIPEHVKGIIHLTGMALILALILVVTWHDIVGIIGG